MVQLTTPDSEQKSALLIDERSSALTQIISQEKPEHVHASSCQCALKLILLLHFTIFRSFTSKLRYICIYL